MWFSVPYLIEKMATNGDRSDRDRMHEAAKEDSADEYASAEESELEGHLSHLNLKTTGESSSSDPLSLGGERRDSEPVDDPDAAERKKEVEETKSEPKKELTEEEKQELLEKGNVLKTQGNSRFKSSEYEPAIQCYSEALELYPSDCIRERSVAYGNRAACWSKLNEHDKVISDCTESLNLDQNYIKVLVRRAQSYEATEKLESALEDYKKVLELEPGHRDSLAAAARLPAQIEEQREKLKSEMMGKLKELGNLFLKPFGMSTDNFKFQQDPNTGSYSVNFQK